MGGFNLADVSNTQPAWYCVLSQPKHEHVAAAGLRRHRKLEVFTPRIRFRRSSKRGPVWVTEALFPNYLFVRFDRDKLLADVQHTLGVATVVHFASFWPTIPDEVVRELQTIVGPEETRLVENTIEVGSEIEIAGGAFEGFRAVVTRVMPARQRVAVLLEFLGKQTVLELDSSSLISTSSWCDVRVGSLAAARLAVK